MSFDGSVSSTARAFDLPASALLPELHSSARGARPKGARVESDRHEIERGWVRAMARGERGALASLYDAYAKTMLALAVRILGDRREAEDVVHDVFLEAWRQSAEYDEQRGSVRAWLLIRLRSRALDRRKSARATRVVSVDGGALAPLAGDDDPSQSADFGRVREALAALPADQRTVVELAYYEGLSSTEIAARTSAPIGTVKSRAAAALAKLRSGLGDAAEPGSVR
jgi:RNA polymerase sigma-70 factor (ECF subfamily)